jgi:hypothetical protein
MNVQGCKLTHNNNIHCLPIYLMSFIFLLGVSSYIFIDETYANGDGTDSWCSTDIPIFPLKMYSNSIYPVPQCFVESCLMGDFRLFVTASLQQASEPGCDKRDANFQSPTYLMCMQ